MHDIVRSMMIRQTLLLLCVCLTACSAQDSSKAEGKPVGSQEVVRQAAVSVSTVEPKDVRVATKSVPKPSLEPSKNASGWKPRPPAEIQKSGNHLKGEGSVYLTQHAMNPLEWYPWGPEALARAQRRAARAGQQRPWGACARLCRLSAGGDERWRARGECPADRALHLTRVPRSSAEPPWHPPCLATRTSRPPRKRSPRCQLSQCARCSATAAGACAAWATATCPWRASRALAWTGRPRGS